MKLYFWGAWKVGAYKGVDVEDRLMVWKEGGLSAKKVAVLVSAQGNVKGAWTFNAIVAATRVVRTNWLGEGWKQTSWWTPRMLGRSRGGWGWDSWGGVVPDEFATRAYWAARNFLTSLGNEVG